MPANKAFFLGSFADDAEAIAFVQAQHWDAGKGDNNPWVGMFYYKESTGEIRVWDGTGFQGGAGFDVPDFYVDPDDPENAYETINAAYAAADAALAAGESVSIVLAPNKTHIMTGPLTLNPLRCLSIDGQSADYIVSTWRATVVQGSFILPDASAAPSRTSFTLKGLSLDGDITATDNWEVNAQYVDLYDTILTRNHGANDVLFSAFNSWLSSLFFIIDNDAPSVPSSGAVLVNGGDLDHLGFGAQFQFVGGVAVLIRNCKITMIGLFPVAVFDFNNAVSQITFRDVTMNSSNFGSNPALFANDANLTANWTDTEITPDAGASVDYGGGTATHTGTATHVAAAADAPVSPFTGMGWRDLTAFTNVIWNGAAWV
jgi:hypothetical protein